MKHDIQLYLAGVGVLALYLGLHVFSTRKAEEAGDEARFARGLFAVAAWNGLLIVAIGFIGLLVVVRLMQVACWQLGVCL